MIIRIIDLGGDKNRELEEFCDTNNIQFLDLSDENHNIIRIELYNKQMIIADNNTIIIGIKEGLYYICKEFIEIPVNDFYYIELM